MLKAGRPTVDEMLANKSEMVAANIRFYSTPAAPLSDLGPLPKGPTDIVESAAIISARMSRTGYYHWLLICQEKCRAEHMSAGNMTHLRDRFIVNGDQISWLRVDFQRSVEAQGCFN
jgi:hypothetical protein